MVSLNVTWLYTNVPIIDTLNIIKDYVNNDNQFNRKTAIPRAKAISTALHPPSFGKDLLMMLIPFYSIHSNNLHQNITFIMKVEINEELAFLDILLKRDNRGTSVLVYRKPTHTEIYLHYSSHHQTSCKESVVSSFFNRAYSIVTNKDDLTKENPRIKQRLKENGCQESIISKIFKRITINHSLSHSQQQTQTTDFQEEEIRMNINLPHVDKITLTKFPTCFLKYGFLIYNISQLSMSHR